MNILDTKVGTKLEIEVLNSLGQKIGQTFISQIMDIVDNRKIVIAAPIHESRISFIPSGARIRAVFLHHVHGLMSFMGLVVKKDKRDNLIEFDIVIETELERIQRRNYFRLDCTLDGQFRIFDETEQQDSITSSAQYKKVITKNVSGCGACIVAEEDVPKGSIIELIVFLDAGNPVRVICKVIRNIEIEVAKGKKYELGLYFNSISEKDQAAIIKFVFDQQKRQKKKGL